MTLDVLAALDHATGQFHRHLAAVGVEDWTAATPCSEWDVHYLVAHVVGGIRFASMILSGRSADDAMSAVMGAPQLGDVPLGAFQESASIQRDAFHDGGRLDQVVSHPLGDILASRFLSMRVFDIALHAWDLAVSIGRDGQLEPDLAEHVLDIVANEVTGMGFGIEPCGDVRPDATAMERLLDLCGRCTRVAEAALPD